MQPSASAFDATRWDSAWSLGSSASALIAVATAIAPVHAQAAGTHARPPSTPRSEAGEADAEAPRRRLRQVERVRRADLHAPLRLRLPLEDIAAYCRTTEQAAARHRARRRAARLPPALQGTVQDQAADLLDARLHVRRRRTRTGASARPGIQVDVPELSGRFFIGRTKEGYSQIKVMVGLHTWGIERSPAIDAFVPILADGIKCMGYFPKQRLFFSLGCFGDALSENGEVRHLRQPGRHAPGMAADPVGGGRRGAPRRRHGARRPSRTRAARSAKSKPGAYLAPYFLDTGKFASDQSRTMGVEAFYRTGPWLFGAEYNWQKVDAADRRDDPCSTAATRVVTWIITGETRRTTRRERSSMRFSRAKSVFEGGPGRGRPSLTSRTPTSTTARFEGGKYWRVTPMVNWHLADNFRLVRLRLRRARPLRPDGRDAVLPDPCSRVPVARSEVQGRQP